MFNVADGQTLRDESRRVKPAWALFSVIRHREVLILQGTPLMGALLAMGKFAPGNLWALALLGAAGFLLVAHIWSLNDWADVHNDRNDRNKRGNVFSGKGVTPARMLCFSIALLAAGLALFAGLGGMPLALACCIALLGVV